MFTKKKASSKDIINQNLHSKPVDAVAKNINVFEELGGVGLAALNGGLFGLGHMLIFNPEASTKQLRRRFLGTAALNACIQAFLPRWITGAYVPSIDFPNFLISAVSGSSLSLGYALLFNRDEKIKRLLARCAGGACIFMGLYIWCPQFMRDLWRHDPKIHFPFTVASLIVTYLKGMVLGYAYSFLTDTSPSSSSSIYISTSSDIVNDRKDDNNVLTVAKRSIGGGFFTLGVYLLSPPGLRRFYWVSQ